MRIKHILCLLNLLHGYHVLYLPLQLLCVLLPLPLNFLLCLTFQENSRLLLQDSVYKPCLLLGLSWSPCRIKYFDPLFPWVPCMTILSYCHGFLFMWPSHSLHLYCMAHYFSPLVIKSLAHRHIIKWMDKWGLHAIHVIIPLIFYLWTKWSSLRYNLNNVFEKKKSPSL